MGWHVPSEKLAVGGYSGGNMDNMEFARRIPTNSRAFLFEINRLSCAAIFILRIYSTSM